MCAVREHGCPSWCSLVCSRVHRGHRRQQYSYHRPGVHEEYIEGTRGSTAAIACDNGDCQRRDITRQRATPSKFPTILSSPQLGLCSTLPKMAAL